MFEEEDAMEGIPQEIIALCIKIQIEQEIDFILWAKEYKPAP